MDTSWNTLKFFFYVAAMNTTIFVDYDKCGENEGGR